METGRGGELKNFVYLNVSLLNSNIMKAIKSHKELIVYQLAFKVSMEIFQITKLFPKEEAYSLTSQIRRSSRSVCANLAEAFRKRRYERAFISKLSDSEGEAAETQVWLDYSKECEYITEEIFCKLFNDYEKTIGMLINMINHPDKWRVFKKVCQS
jgi:four helix bundle protein